MPWVISNLLPGIRRLRLITPLRALVVLMFRQSALMRRIPIVPKFGWRLSILTRANWLGSKAGLRSFHEADMISRGAVPADVLKTLPDPKVLAAAVAPTVAQLTAAKTLNYRWLDVDRWRGRPNCCSVRL